MGQLKIYKQRFILNELKDTLAVVLLTEGYGWDVKTLNDLIRNLDFVQNTAKEKDEIFGKRWVFNSIEDHYYNINFTDSFANHKKKLDGYIADTLEANLALKFNIPLYKAYIYDEKKGLTFFGESYGDNPVPVSPAVSP